MRTQSPNSMLSFVLTLFHKAHVVMWKWVHKMDWSVVGRPHRASDPLNFHSLKDSNCCRTCTEVERAHGTPTPKQWKHLINKTSSNSLWLTHTTFARFIWDWTSDSISIDAAPIKTEIESLNQFVFRAERFNHNRLQLISILRLKSFME